MADIKMLVDYSSVKAANKALEQSGTTAKKSASVFEAAFKKAEAQSKKNLVTLRQQLATSKRLSDQKAREAKAAAASANLVAKEEERLKNKFVEGYTAMNIYTKEMNDLAVARKRGIISTKEQTAAVASLNAQMKAGTGAFANAATGMQIVGKRANRTGVLAQQAGYQFGDFAVQVQSGTNPMVAFGQQATQLIGTFSMLAKSTKAIVAFSALGVIVPVITAVAGALMRVSKESDETSKRVERFEDSLESARSEVQGMKEDLELLQSGFKEVFELTLSKSVEEATKNLADARLKLEQASTAAALYGTGAAGGLSLSSLGIGKSEGDKVAAAKEALRLAVLELSAAKELSRQLEKRKRDASVVNQLHETRNILQEASSKAEEEYSSLVDKTRAAMGQVAAEATVLSGGVADVASELDLGYKEALKLQEEMEKAEGYALGITKVDMESGILAAAAQAAILAKNMGISLGLALDLVALAGKSQAENLFDTKVRTGIIPPQASGDFSLEGGSKTPLALRTYMSAVDARGKARQTAEKRGGGGGGAKVVDKTSPLKDLQKQLLLEKELVGKSEEYVRVRKSLGDTYSEVEPKAISSLESQIVLINEARKAEEDRQSVVKTVESSLESGFMSMIDGTKSVKDAFKDMARQIIAELMRVLVVKRAVSAVTSLFGFADGGVFSGGAQVKAFADGGVVGGPTFFPMSGGKTGLMGEAGPEAIMPLKRGANGKLGVQMEGGSDGGVNIVQNFNFSASGDESVKKLIAQAAPQIANMTQKQIMDSRRRGGAMKSTFG